MDGQFNTGDQPVDRDPNRSGEFHPALPTADPGFCIVGRTMGPVGCICGNYFDGTALLRAMGDFPGNSCIRRSASAASSDVFPFAAVPAIHIVLGTLVGDQAEKSAG